MGQGMQPPCACLDRASAIFCQPNQGCILLLLMIAVNKPPFVITAPKHRYIGGSMVNRIIGEPLLVFRSINSR